MSTNCRIQQVLENASSHRLMVLGMVAVVACLATWGAISFHRWDAARRKGQILIDGIPGCYAELIDRTTGRPVLRTTLPMQELYALKQGWYDLRYGEAGALTETTTIQVDRGEVSPIRVERPYAHQWRLRDLEGRETGWLPTHDGDDLVVMSEHRIVCYDGRSGEQRWQWDDSSSSWNERFFIEELGNRSVARLVRIGVVRCQPRFTP